MHAHRELELGPDGFRLAVVADTHSKPHPAAAEQLRARSPNAILHAGDIGELSVLDELEQIAPVIAIRGNIDPPARELPETLILTLIQAGQLVIRLLLQHIAVYGPKLRKDARELARRERASLVVCGHSHVPFIGRDAGLSVFNPGSVGPRRFGLPIVFGMMELVEGRLHLHHVDCETGALWTPG